MTTPPLITIDVEDWPQSSWDRDLPISKRAADNTLKVLDVLETLNVRATMFILGKFAETFPEIVKAIHAKGHEIGSHGHGHVEIFKQSPEEFREDVRRTKAFLEDLTGEQVRGYRAPDFSIITESLWALTVLAEVGYEYDSSIFPVKRNRYGIPTWPIDPARVILENNRSILEFPIATITMFQKNWPIGGGGYHRLLPGFLSRMLADRSMQQAPFVFYCHPYEFDPSEFREIEHKIPLPVALHQGLGRRWFEDRFKSFVRSFGGSPVADYIDSQETWREMKVTDIVPAVSSLQN